MQSVLGEGVFFATGPKVSQNQGKKRVLFGNQGLTVKGAALMVVTT